jgi:hypothetical protein
MTKTLCFAPWARESFPSRNLLAIFATLLVGTGVLFFPSQAQAQDGCGVTKECTAPHIGTWRYLASYNATPCGVVINKWFNSFGEAEAAIMAACTNPLPTDWCSLNVASYEQCAANHSLRDLMMR